MIASTLLNLNTTGCQKAEKDENFRVECHLMDKIAAKSYLETAKEGIPSTLRILAFDLPELRKEAFAGECHLAHDKIFVDDISPTKVIDVPGRDDDSKETKAKKDNQKLKIVQKALVKVRFFSWMQSLLQCTL
jgi:hypothetical protein